MIQNIRRWVQQRFFARELLEIEARLEGLKILREKATITALVREQLKGFNPFLLDSDKEILAEFGNDSDALNTFLADVKDLHDNKAWPRIRDYLVREQIMYGMKEAEDLIQTNFSRATINGITLMDEEIDSLYAVYVKLHEAQGEFDDTEIV